MFDYDKLGSESCKYEFKLLGLVHHIPGHYKAICFYANNNSWWEYDDMNVNNNKKLDSDTKVSPHILVYFKTKIQCTF